MAPVAGHDRLPAPDRAGAQDQDGVVESDSFTDIDGSLPDYKVLENAFEQAKKTYLAPLVDAARFTKSDWKLVTKTDVPS